MKMHKANFANVILADQAWVRRHHVAMPLEESIEKGLLEYYYFVHF